MKEVPLNNMKREKIRRSINYLYRVFGFYILPIFLLSLELQEIFLKWAGQRLTITSGWFQLVKNFRNINICTYTFSSRGRCKYKARFFDNYPEHSSFIAQRGSFAGIVHTSCRVQRSDRIDRFHPFTGHEGS